MSATVKSHAWQRWLILLFTCIMMIGNYYSYDIPAALNTQLDEYFGKTEDFEIYFSLLYTLYSIPNIILPFFGGYFVDRLGVRLCLLVFACAITIGQIIFAFGVSIKSWPVMFLGRIVFGFGGESLGVGNSALLSQWFMGKELAFAFGLNLSIARLGSVFNNLLSPALATSANVQFAVWFGAILCGASVFSVICLSSIDKSFESTSSGMHSQLLNDEEDGEPSKPKEEEEKTSLKDVFLFPQAFWVLVISCVVVYGKIFCSRSYP
jgi:MFS family permease